MPLPTPVRRLAPLAVGLLLLAGCGEPDEIRTYTVKKPPPEVYEEKVRLLAAIFDQGPQQWFIKFLGPKEEVSKHARAFEEMLHSVRLRDDANQPIEWKLPSGWSQDPAAGLRHATIHPGEKGKVPEITVFRLPRSSLLANINRWCELDLGRRKLRPMDLDKVARAFQAGDETAVLVDMTGPGVVKKPGHGGMHPPIPPAGGGGAEPGKSKPASRAITYTVPSGWKETGPRVSTRMGISIPIHTAFDVDAGKKAEVTVQVFPGGFGDWSWNVNRWRREVGLGEVTAADKDRERSLAVAGTKAPYLDLAGAEKRSLVTVVTRGKQTWFFKLLGDKTVVGDNKNKFESFVQSVRFTGAADE